MESPDSSTANKTDTDSLLRHIRFEHLYAGISGGVVSTLILHPLDLVKIRFQVNEGHGASGRPAYQGIMHAMRTIVKNSGFVGLYQGVTPNIWGAGISWGFYFFFYNSMKTWMQDGDAQKNLGAATHLALASTAGFATLSITNPIWVTKTRLCLQYESSEARAKPDKRRYRGMVHALAKIYKEEGMRGLYKGFVPGMLGISHGALQFMAYEELKTIYNQYREQPLDTRLGSGEYILFAAVSKMFAASLTYPYQVIRSRLQDQHRQYGGVRDVCRQILKKESVLGFYKGFSPYMVHMTPNICMVFLLYELLVQAGTEPPFAVKTEAAEIQDTV
ncbi:solute carrier family 25 member 32-like isoform X1 [Littorina saxatilis]|uniref:solute carrier family 25 member 32-like isoform X1 n=1 Tax=Littorina saxatilis TaxID=31220 RepID=UPI0038B48981